MSKRVLVLYRDFDEVEPYRAAIAAQDLDPVLVSASEPRPLKDFAGLLLTGGSDVDPARYGQLAAPETDEPDTERDEVECRLIADAMDRDVPVLAICRGLQIMNVQAGGTLVQHLALPLHAQRPANLALPAHEVEIAPQSVLADVAAEPVWRVNSRHHQAIDRLGDGLRVSAVSNDGVVEAIERPGSRFCVAVQWHPENQSPVDPAQAKLFRRFAHAL